MSIYSGYEPPPKKGGSRYSRRVEHKGSSYASDDSGGVSVDGSGISVGGVTAGGGVGVGNDSDDGRHGVVGFIKNAEQNLGEIAYGLPAGVAHLGVNAAKDLAQSISLNFGHPGEHRGKLRLEGDLRAIVEDTYDRYGRPLVHGDFDALADALYARPIDAALLGGGLTSAGGRAAVLTGKAAERAGLVSDTSRLARLGDRSAITVRNAPALLEAGKLRTLSDDLLPQENAQTRVLRLTSTNPVKRLAQESIDAALKLLPVTAPVVGELSRFRRAIEFDVHHLPEAERVRHTAYDEAVGKLRPWERRAAYFALTGEDPVKKARQLRAEKTRLQNAGKRVEPQYDLQIRELEDPRVAEAAASDRVGRVVQLGRSLSTHLTEQRVARARAEAEKLIADVTDETSIRERIERRADELVSDIKNQTTDAVARAEARAERDVRQSVESRVQSITNELDQTLASLHERPYLHLRLQSGARFTEPIDAPGVRRQQAYVASLERDFERASRKAGRNEFTAAELKKINFEGVTVPGTVTRARTLDEAQAALRALDGEYDRLLNTVVEHLKGDVGHDPAETLRRNQQRAEFDAQQSGKNRAGRPNGASGKKVRSRPKTLAKDLRDLAESRLLATIEARPDDPAVRDIANLVAERGRLRATVEAKHPLLGDPDANVDLGQITTTGEVPVRAEQIGGLTVTPEGAVLRPKGSANAQRVGGALSVARDKLDRMERAAARRHRISVSELRQRVALDAPTLTGGRTLEEIRQELDAAGAHHPVYVPDLALDRTRPSLIRAGGGRGVPRAEEALRQDRGILYLTARLAHDPESLSVGFLNYVRAETHRAVHRALVENSVQIPVGEGIPKGWTYIRPNSSTHILHTEKVQASVLERLTAVIPDDATAYSEGLVTKKEAEAATIDGRYRLAVPERFAKELAGEFTRTQSTIRKIVSAPFQVWRALVLGGRVAFFTNNVVGNHILLAVRYAGPTGLRAYLSFLREVKGGRYVDGFVKSREFRDIMAAATPELIHGTFGRTQFPTSIPGGRAIGNQFPTLKRAARGVGPLTAKVSEDIPREVSVRATVMRIAKEQGVKLSTQTEEFNRFARETLSDPANARRAVDEANKALGDYLNMSEFERRYVRQAVPFYGWIRAITMIAGRTAIETPGRALLLANIGHIGAEDVKAAFGGEVPAFLLAFVPVGKRHGDSVPGIATGGLNPYATLPQLLSAAGTLLPGAEKQNARDLVSQLNPFLGAGATQLSRLLGGNTSDNGLIGDTAVAVGKQLPFSRIASPPNATIYESGRGKEIASYFGVPYRKASASAALAAALRAAK